MKFKVGQRVYMHVGGTFAARHGYGPGYYNVIAATTKGGMVLADVDRNSRSGEPAYALSKSPRGGALWFSEKSIRAVRSTKGNRAGGAEGADPTEASELEIYIDNDADLYRQQGQPILRNLANKAAQGKYDHAKAVKLYMYLMDNGAKKYAKEFSQPSDWNRIFSVPTRKMAAESFARSFETEYKLGNYDSYLTKASIKKKGVNRAGRASSEDRLFTGVYPTGISYADRSREVDGDYKRLAFLPFSTLKLEWEKNVPADLKKRIEASARKIQARRGEQFQVSASGQTVMLG